MKSLTTRQFVFATTFLSALSIFAVWKVSPGLSGDSARAAGFFALIGILAQALAHRLPRGAHGSIAFIPFLSSLAVAPGLPLIGTVALAVLCGEVLLRREPLKATFNVAQYVLSIALAILTYSRLGGKAMHDVPSPPIGPFIAAFATFLVVNTMTVAGVVAVSQKRRLFQVWRQNTHGTLLYDFLALPAVYFFGYVYAVYGAKWAAALAIPLFGLRQLYKTNWQLQTINEELLQLMVAAIEARDPYTSGHSQRVAGYSRIVSHAAGLHSKAAERVYTAALLHDVGKIHEEFAPILRKPGRLTDEEFSIMKTHSVRGATLVGKVTQFRDLIPAIRSHHEAWDGHGYPDGLAGAAIPQWARIIAIADTIDAMTTDRPYRDALDEATVREEVRRESVRQFDPLICERLLRPDLWEKMAQEIAGNRPRRLEPSASDVGPSARPSVPVRVAATT
jgi:HD superfamily phosphohydrolase YqeK